MKKRALGDCDKRFVLLYGIGVAIAVLLLIIVCIIKFNTPSITESKVLFKEFSIDAIRCESRAIQLNALAMACGVIILYFIISLFFIKSQSKFWLMCTLTIVFFIAVIIVSFVCGRMYFQRDRISIKSQEELTFDMPEIYGDNIEFTDEFKVNMYKWYCETAKAYNKLCIDGNFQEFFAVIKESEYYSYYAHYATELLEMQNSGTGYSKCIARNQRFSPKQIPIQSIYCGVRLEHKNYYLKDRRFVVYEVMDTINTVLDIFYGEELLCEKAIHYSEHKYVGNYNPSMEAPFVVNDICIDDDRNGSINFTYLDVQYECKVEEGKVYFAHDNQPRLMHVISSNVIINDSCGVIISI